MLDEYNIPGFSLPFNTSFSVRGTLPPVDYLKFPPADLPKTLLPPPDHPTLAHPFTIRSDWYNGMLSANVPITIALIYATVVTYLNSVNHNRKYKPWAFSQTQLFKLLVITHNILLALYSGWTFIGMINALAISVVPPTGPHGLAGTVDSLCKINGPRGMGSAAVYDSKGSAWGIANRAFHLAADGLLPESSDVGRIWNEGLAFYGWLFYLSKFYEVVDTFIILAKGKKSSLLQTYHHAGAMLCMWAGIRYMSPPIWMFVLVNSFIHTIMYTFYFCTAIGIKVPVPLKKTLTTMQITQFVVGAGYAFGHLFIKYQSPISVPYLYHLGDVASAVPSDASSAASYALATASAGPIAWLKKAALRAAGREGLAENIWNEEGKPFGIDALHAAQDFVKREEIRYRDQLHWVHCLDTSGQVFAILLNCMYLAPLTLLFVQFFVKAYTNRIDRRRRSSASAHAAAVYRSGEDASKGVVRQLSEAFDDVQTGVTELGDDEAVIDGEELKQELKSVVDSAKLGTASALSALKDQADRAKAKIPTDLRPHPNQLSGEGEHAKSASREDDQAVEEHTKAPDAPVDQPTEDNNDAHSAAKVDRRKTDLDEEEPAKADAHSTARPSLEEDKEAAEDVTETDPPKDTDSDNKRAGPDTITETPVAAERELPTKSSEVEDSASITHTKSEKVVVEPQSDIDNSESSAKDKDSTVAQGTDLVDEQTSHADQELDTDQEASWIHVDADEQHDSSQPDQSLTEPAGHHSEKTTREADVLPDRSHANEEANESQAQDSAPAAEVEVSDQPEETAEDEKTEPTETVDEDTKEDSSARSATETLKDEAPNASLESQSSNPPNEADQSEPVVLTEQPAKPEGDASIKEGDAGQEAETGKDQAQHTQATEKHEEKTSKPESVGTVAEVTGSEAADAETSKSTKIIPKPEESSAEENVDDSSAIENATSSDHQFGDAPDPAEDDRTYAEVVAEEPAESKEEEAQTPSAQDHVEVTGTSEDVPETAETSTEAETSQDSEQDHRTPELMDASKTIGIPDQDHSPEVASTESTTAVASKPGEAKEEASVDEKLAASAEELLPPVKDLEKTSKADGEETGDAQSGETSKATKLVEKVKEASEAPTEPEVSAVESETDSAAQEKEEKGARTMINQTANIKAAGAEQTPKRKPPKLEIRNKTKQHEESASETTQRAEEPSESEDDGEKKGSATADQDSETQPAESQESKDAGDETTESNQGTPSKDGA